MSTDKEGWQYAVDFPAQYTPDMKFTSCVRRRRWIKFRFQPSYYKLYLYYIKHYWNSTRLKCLCSVETTERRYWEIHQFYFKCTDTRVDDDFALPLGVTSRRIAGPRFPASTRIRIKNRLLTSPWVDTICQVRGPTAYQLLENWVLLLVRKLKLHNRSCYSC